MVRQPFVFIDELRGQNRQIEIGIYSNAVSSTRIGALLLYPFIQLIVGLLRFGLSDSLAGNFGFTCGFETEGVLRVSAHCFSRTSHNLLYFSTNIILRRLSTLRSKDF